VSIEENGSFELTQLMRRELGVWPILEDSYQPSNEDLLSKMVKYAKAGIFVLFDVCVVPDPIDPHQLIIRVNLISFRLFFRLNLLSFFFVKNY
jgi:hypothetical protein